ncbi:hypothetical protein [Parazoarcus communis]|uniref:hypothetical protein n=1 Tax=Parazoarcus communis TaxID=41977 RepID=UPI00131ED1D9|nr:hypothetical protein [Parazoarcus communis]
MNSPEKTPKPDMTPCPKCGELVAKHNLARHFARAHSPEKELRSTANENFKVVNDARRIFMSTLVKCTKCKRNIKLVEIKSHFATAHQSPVPPDMLALVGLSEPTNLFKSDREREAYWREKSGFESCRGEDLFDRSCVITGGAYGLGKNRKH